jgi:hypothetical protein
MGNRGLLARNHCWQAADKLEFAARRLKARLIISTYAYA